jgi:hypothetical protein
VRPIISTVKNSWACIDTIPREKESAKVCVFRLHFKSSSHANVVRISSKMASTPYKNNLTVGGSPFDKAKLQMRRPTPDSDVLASSDDDHEAVAPPPTRPTGAPFATARRPSWMAQDLPNRKNSLPSVSLGSQLMEHKQLHRWSIVQSPQGGLAVAYICTRSRRQVLRCPAIVRD